MKATVISIVIASIMIIGVIVLTSSGGGGNNNQQNVNNVSVVDGKQIITINAKGGYYPKVTTAKALTPTELKMTTNGTFDCSSILSIPSLGYRSSLQSSGVTQIEIPPQQVGTKIQGFCAMGMYNFTINFQ